MRKPLLVLLALVISVSVAFAGATAEEGATAAAEMDMGKALGLYPEFFQFASLTEMEAKTGIKLTEFGESPHLAALVAKGELDPVEERLPEQPLVIVRNEIGRYGGTLRPPTTVNPPMSSVRSTSSWNRCRIPTTLTTTARAEHPAGE